MSPSCRLSPPEAFSSPSVTTIWRKLCSPYSSQMWPRSSSDFRDASMRAVAPLLTLYRPRMDGRCFTSMSQTRFSTLWSKE